ncbi:DNA sulfur modification protein DndB [Pseudoroseomonas aestuarii]
MAENESPNEDTTRRFKLGDLKRTGARTDFSTPVLRGFNMGNGTLSLTLTMEQFRENSDVPNELRIMETTGIASDIAQRPLDEKHSKAIALYMLRGLVIAVRDNWIDEGKEIPTELEDILSELGEGPYQAIQPFTGNIRHCAPGGADLDIEMRPDGKLVLFLRQGQLIYVIDGQHRRHAYELLRLWLGEVTQTGRYKKRGSIYVPEDLAEDGRVSAVELEIWNAVLQLARSHFTVDVTVHLGLKSEQERQLFHDLNNLGKKPDAALAQAFDNANPVSVFVRKEIEGNRLLGTIRIADSGSKKGQRKAEDVPTIYRDDLASSNALLFAGATNQSGIIGSAVTPHYDYARRFWRAIAAQDHFGVDKWEERTILAEAVVIKALAQLAYTFHGSREKDHDLRDRFLSALEDKKISFEHKDDLWSLYFKDDADRAAIDPRLDEYLTPDAGRKSYAVWQGDQLSFASNTRDIARYLGDLIRWKLELPPRPGIAQLKAKLIREGKMAAPGKPVSSAA